MQKPWSAFKLENTPVFISMFLWIYILIYLLIFSVSVCVRILVSMGAAVVRPLSTMSLLRNLRSVVASAYKTAYRNSVKCKLVVYRTLYRTSIYDYVCLYNTHTHTHQQNMGYLCARTHTHTPIYQPHMVCLCTHTQTLLWKAAAFIGKGMKIKQLPFSCVQVYSHYCTW